MGIPAQLAVVKKLRKPSHQKHNSIDRTHYLPKAQAKNTIKKISLEVELKKPAEIAAMKQLKSFDHSSKNAQGSFEHNLANLNENYKGSNEASGNSGGSKKNPNSNQSQIQEAAGSSYGQENVKPMGISQQSKAKIGGNITQSRGHAVAVNKSGSNSKSNQVSSGSTNVIKKHIKTFQNGPTKMEIIFATQDLQKKPSKIQSQKQTFCT